jgi:hypothetical protein
LIHFSIKDCKCDVRSVRNVHISVMGYWNAKESNHNFKQRYSASCLHPYPSCIVLPYRYVHFIFFCRPRRHAHNIGSKQQTKHHEHQSYQQQQQHSTMKIIHVALILSAIFGVAAGRLGDTPPTVALQARTLQGPTFGSLQASAVTTPIVSNMGSVGSAVAVPIGIGVGSVGSAVATPIGSGANLQAIDLGAIFGGDVTGSIDVEALFAAAQGIDSEYFFDEAATGAEGIGSDDAPQGNGRRRCFVCARSEDPFGNITRVCLFCVSGKKNEGSAAGPGPGAAATPIGIGP